MNNFVYVILSEAKNLSRKRHRGTRNRQIAKSTRNRVKIAGDKAMHKVDSVYSPDGSVQFGLLLREPRLRYVARRSGDTWFMAIMNGPTVRSLDIPISFLDEREYRAMLIRDSSDDPAEVEAENTALKCSDSPAIQLIDGGGFVARFSRNDDQ
jgi:hypothetical protein